MAGGNEMMAARQTVGMYPRIDTFFKKKHSLDFDLMKTKIMQERKSNENVLWIAHIICGLFMGFIGFVINWVTNLI